MEYLTRIPVFRATSQKHSPARNIAQITEQCRASARPTRIPLPLSRQQSLKTPANQGFSIHRSSSSGCLCDKPLQSQQQQHSRTVALRRSDASTKAQNANKRENRLQIHPTTSPSSNTTGASPSRRNATPGTDRDSNREFARRAKQQRIEIRGRANSNSRVLVSGQQTNRSSTGSPQQRTGDIVTPDPCMPIEECGERIERLLQRVQHMHREYETQQVPAQPQTSTRLNERRGLSPETHINAAGERGHDDIKCSATSSVATDDISDNGAPGTTVESNNGKAYTPQHDSEIARPDAETGTTQNFLGTELAAKTPAERTREKLALLRARRVSQLGETETGRPRRGSEIARPVSEPVATHAFFGTELAAETPAERTREKLALLRARRASQLGETEPGTPQHDSEIARPDAETGATQTFFGTELAAKTPAERTREKLALLRARRASQLRETKTGSPRRGSEIARPVSEPVATQTFFGTELAAKTPAERTREKLALLRARRVSQLEETETGSPRRGFEIARPVSEPVATHAFFGTELAAKTPIERTREKLALLRARRASQPGETEPDSPRRGSEIARPVSEPVATHAFFGTELAAKTPIERTREKLALLRARRAARQGEKEDASPTSEQTKDMVRIRSESLRTTFCPSDESDEDNGAGFFESFDNLMLFREVDRPVRDITWDKRVFYYHVSRTNERFRHATEDVTIADCRDSCLADLAGQQGTTQERNSSGARVALASRRHSRGAPDFRQHQDAENVAEFDEQMEDDDDWWVNRFGYIDFRRRSCSSMASTTSLSSSALEHYSAPPTPSPACSSPEPLASPSYTSSGHTWSITSSTARAATANFDKAVSAAAAAASPLPEEEFFDASMLDREDPAAKPISAVDAEEPACAQLREVNCNVSRARAAIQALTRLVLRAM